MSFVMQDVFLFSDTILENVKLGKKDTLTLSSIKEASRRAQASSFIEKMESQYDTVIGERISAVCHADEILILENGQIVERGTHDELLAKKGHYYQTFVAQYGVPESEVIA